MGRKPRREVMCKECLEVFTTRDRRRFKCYKCEPVPGTEPKPRHVPQARKKKTGPARPFYPIRKPKGFPAGEVFKNEFDKLKGLK